MRLLSIQLHNFRQFYGTTPELRLAASGDRKVTVIHGNNGAGKTSLLNAFTWALYKKTTAAFASPDQLVNKRALAEAAVNEPVECWVELACEHGATQYRIRRSCRAYRTDTGEIVPTRSDLSLKYAGEDGRWRNSEQHLDDVIGRILPVSLHQYFFFDGERIEQIVRSNKKTEIAEATKALLGVEVLTRAIRHLGEARKTLEKELERFGDPETQTLVQQKQTREEEREQIAARQGEIESEIEQFKRLRQAVANALRESEAVRAEQKRRDDLESQKQSVRDALEQCRVRLKSTLSTQGYTVLLPGAIAQFRALEQGLRQRGELPADIKQQFVQDLLDRQRCICGTVLEAGSNHYHQVKAYLERAGLADVEETVIRMGAQMEAIARQIPVFWQTVDEEQRKIGDLRQTLSRIETELDTIHEQLRNSPIEDIRNLEKRHEDIDAKIQALNREQGENDQRVKDLSQQIEDLRRQIEKHQATETRQAQAQRRIAATEEAIARLKQVQTNVDRVFRSDLERRVREIFQRIVVAPYVPRLTEKYELHLVESTTGQERLVPASTGENQVLSLSFIGAIIDRVRDWSRRDQQNRYLMPPDAGNYPMVMDSPFGSLDETYRRQVGRSLPTLANQLVVLVSKTQWRGEVAEELDPYLGRQYVLVYHSPKADVEPDAIALNGTSYSLVRRSPNEFEYTEIIAVEG
ncbi:AAA family ATPase [Leptolyngbya sp. O-77]|uniref:AAA family ATPase n=1 Tax=Leptolyngbya sp. O-77 TaxID=1080068 RepID=UPI00074D4409|nr:AAA family ATPase [Leptolyngbya sp. O-77]BAU41431.1 chromosome segregation protein [Leptolyngbya sp. O-77]